LARRSATRCACTAALASCAAARAAASLAWGCSSRRGREGRQTDSGRGLGEAHGAVLCCRRWVRN
jgi:hypothetical protein